MQFQADFCFFFQYFIYVSTQSSRLHSFPVRNLLSFFSFFLVLNALFFLWRLWGFPLCHWFWTFDYDVLLWSILHVSYAWSWSRSLDLCVYSFHQIGKIGGIIFSNIFLVPPSSPSGTSSTYTGCLELFHSLLTLCCYCYYHYYHYYLLQPSLSK